MQSSTAARNSGPLVSRCERSFLCRLSPKCRSLQVLEPEECSSLFLSPCRGRGQNQFVWRSAATTSDRANFKSSTVRCIFQCPSPGNFFARQGCPDFTRCHQGASDSSYN